MIETLSEASSTNTVLVERLGSGKVVPEGTWLRAERQTAGRGRAGRIWVSDPGNLYCSTVVHLVPGDPSAHTLSLVAGLAVHDMLAELLSHEVRPLLKWPNDLLVDGAKIAGILCERVLDSVVVGIGVNIASAPVVADRPTTSIHELGGKGGDTPQILSSLAGFFAERLRSWRDKPLTATIAAWEKRAHETGTQLSVRDRGKKIVGTFSGLAEDGALQLGLLDGALRTIHAGDVELEKD